MRVARAFQSEIESLFVEDEQLFDCAAYGFVREVSLTGRQRRADVARRHDARPAPGGPGARGGSSRRWRARPRCRCARASCATSRCGRCRSPAPRRARGTWWRWPSRSPAATAACSSSCWSRSPAPPGSSWSGPKARRVTGPAIVAVEDIERLPAMLRAAERLAALDGAADRAAADRPRRGAARTHGRPGAPGRRGARGRAHRARPRWRAARRP